VEQVGEGVGLHPPRTRSTDTRRGGSISTASRNPLNRGTGRGGVVPWTTYRRPNARAARCRSAGAPISTVRSRGHSEGGLTAERRLEAVPQQTILPKLRERPVRRGRSQFTS